MWINVSVVKCSGAGVGANIFEYRSRFLETGFKWFAHEDQHTTNLKVFKKYYRLYFLVKDCQIFTCVTVKYPSSIPGTVKLCFCLLNLVLLAHFTYILRGHYAYRTVIWTLRISAVIPQQRLNVEPEGSVEAGKMYFCPFFSNLVKAYIALGFTFPIALQSGHPVFKFLQSLQHRF